MRGQVFSMDALLGLALIIIAFSAVAGTVSPLPPSAPSLRASAACYDLANYIYSDSEFYSNITSGMESGARISGAELSLLRGRLRYYGEILGLSSVTFSIAGVQNEHVEISSSVSFASEKCCFPLPIEGGKRVPIACLEASS